MNLKELEGKDCKIVICSKSAANGTITLRGRLLAGRGSVCVIDTPCWPTSFKPEEVVSAEAILPVIDAPAIVRSMF